ncbi:MAG: tetratricopeptide repeat protein, partial [Allosphingosinicella sp.]
LWTRPYAGALAGAFLVAVIGLPFVWTAFDDYAGKVGEPGRPPVAASGKTGRAPVRTDPAPAVKSPPVAADLVESPVPDKPPQALARPAVPAARAPAARPEAPAAEAEAEERSEITVTGARIRRPNLESAMPVTSVGGEEFFQTRDRQAARAARPGDWNACTIEDPGQSLERCRGSLKTATRGAGGKGSAPLADGLAKAWTGDLDGAMTAFDRAIELSPRSSSAWLNRGLAWRRRGDLERALADLDRAVQYAPNDARVYYHRGLVLRQRGDLRRARADEARAVELDPRYAPLVRSR